MPRSCDVCQAATALVYCRADTAYLCMDCDVNVHVANKIASRHERVWMCEVCEQTPAVVTCKADAAALCLACDTDIHTANHLASRHERCPLMPFFECVGLTAVNAAESTLVKQEEHNAEYGIVVGAQNQHDCDDDEVSVAEAESWLLPADGAFRDGLENSNAGNDKTINKSRVEEKPKSKDCEAGGIFSDDDLLLDMHSASVLGNFKISSSSHDFGVVPDTGEVSTAPQLVQSLLPIQSALQPDPRAREARVLRYKQKRMSRKFEKTIRYASRKAYAEIRPRVKGRFIKRTETEGVSQILPVVPAGCGIVPSLYNFGEASLL